MTTNSTFAFPEQTTNCLLPGPAGDLEVAVSWPASTDVKAVVIICHPNPQQGGTMQNKVVTTLARTFHEMNFVTVRFNFRGIGKSQGEFDNKVGETKDLQALIAWVKEAHPQWPLWLAGFSFGSYVATNAAGQTKDVQQLLTVAPPVNLYDWDVLAPVHCPWTVVQGDQDDMVPAEGVRQWVAEQPRSISLIEFANAGHFFHGCLITLRETLHKHYGAL